MTPKINYLELYSDLGREPQEVSRSHSLRVEFLECLLQGLANGRDIFLGHCDDGEWGECVSDGFLIVLGRQGLWGGPFMSLLRRGSMWWLLNGHGR